ncbi:MAG TPA: VanZ family protein [Burkholderiaceae bacterium]|jgi:VanZ family protein|nr:VanZ family protein [Burkholderiaceae bacterium]
MHFPKHNFIPAPSASARVGWLVYTFLIVYASCYPFSDWHSIGLSPLAYLSAPLPHYWTRFDVITNVIAYAPFGTLMVFALYPKVRHAPALILALLAGALLSGVMEAAQTFLPNRVSSNLDLIANSAGVFIGAAAGVLLTRTFLEESHLLLLRRRWFSHEAGRGLIVVALWPLAQIYPQGYLFGHGQFAPILSEWLSDWLAMPVDIGALLQRGELLTVEQYWLSEAVITACGVTGALLTLLSLLRERAPKMLPVMAVLAAAVAVKSLASALQFSPDNAFAWMTPGAEGGLLLGLVMLSGLIFAPPVAQRRVAILTLLISLVIVNAAPTNPYFIATLQAWVQGKFLNFNGAAQFLSLVWPIFTLWFLLHPVHRRGFT